MTKLNPGIELYRRKMFGVKGYARGTRTISSPGKKPITFHPGALHEQLGVPQGKKIPASKMAAARSGKLGPLAEKRANFAKNVLTGPK